MAETFPSAPRAPTAVRAAALAVALVAVAVGLRVTASSLAFVDQPFPGFFVLRNRVVASIGVPGTSVPEIFQHEIVAVDGEPVGSQAEIYDRVRVWPAGRSFRYLVRKGDASREVVVPSVTFTQRDWVVIFGAYLLNATVYLVSGLVAWTMRPRSPLSRGFLAFGAVFATFWLTAIDLYAPGTFTRVHMIADALTPAAGFQLFMLFPQPHPRAERRFWGYALGLLLAAAYQVWFHNPPMFSRVLVVSTLCFGAIGLFMGWRLVVAYRTASSRLARQRVRILTVGVLLGLGVPGVTLTASALAGNQTSMNVAVFTPALFALSLAYAIVKHDVLEVDAMLKRGASYLLLTGAIGAVYALAVVVLNWVLSANVVTSSPAFAVLFTMAVLLVFNPARTRLQAMLDRVFFRTRYDSAEALARLGTALGTAHDRDRVAALVRDDVGQAIPNDGTRLCLLEDDGSLVAIDSDARAPAPLGRHLATGRLVTAFDSPESYADEAAHREATDALAAIDGEIAVPLARDGALVGALVLGPKRSGLFYTAGDSDFLRAVAQQAVIALDNAASYQALADLNASLEDRVRERTAQLEEANGALSRAYGDLQAAQVQLVQSEKMASLGRLVAGVAHEINNPVSFIASSVAPLKRRLAKASAAAPEDVRKLLVEAEEITTIMARGAERTAAIVRDLRTFSRVGEAAWKEFDLVDAIEVGVRLLSPRWRDRVTIHRDFGTLPLVEGDPGQLNQVFVNVLANACDAIAGDGNVWLAAHVVGEDVEVTVRDDGAGMPEEVRARVFEPFFTTKDVGSGTGLGLAISYNVMVAHGGRIEIDSAPGRGTTVRIVLPVRAAGVREQSA